MPTDFGFTGQRADATTGLDYYGARYYDPLAGQFTSPDTGSDLNQYAYADGNPVTLTDPTGHRPTRHSIGRPQRPTNIRQKIGKAITIGFIGFNLLNPGATGHQQGVAPPSRPGIHVPVGPAGQAGKPKPKPKNDPKQGQEQEPPKKDGGKKPGDNKGGGKKKKGGQGKKGKNKSSLDVWGRPIPDWGGGTITPRPKPRPRTPRLPPNILHMIDSSTVTDYPGPGSTRIPGLPPIYKPPTPSPGLWPPSLPGGLLPRLI